MRQDDETISQWLKREYPDHPELWIQWKRTARLISFFGFMTGVIAGSMIGLFFLK